MGSGLSNPLCLDTKLSDVHVEHLTDKEIILDSWGLLVKHGLQNFGTLYFTKVFDASSEIFDVFNIPKGTDLKENIHMKNHSVVFMKTIAKGVANYDDLDKLAKVFEKLGSTHATFHGSKGAIKSSYYDIMGIKFIETLKEVLNRYFSPRVQKIWTVFITELFSMVQSGQLISGIYEDNRYKRRQSRESHKLHDDIVRAMNDHDNNHNNNNNNNDDNEEEEEDDDDDDDDDESSSNDNSDQKQDDNTSIDSKFYNNDSNSVKSTYANATTANNSRYNVSSAEQVYSSVDDTDIVSPLSSKTTSHDIHEIHNFKSYDSVEHQDTRTM